jgi:GNAT superfamily N-acetyltransferase
MADFPKEFVPNLEIWTPEMAEGEQFGWGLAELNERGIVAARGVTPELVGALGIVANQRHIVEFCESEPGRFGTKNKTTEWQQKGREMFTLHQVDGYEDESLKYVDLENLDQGDLKLLAYGWSGPSKNKCIPGADITTAFRSTEQGRGKRLATPLVKFVVGATIVLHRDIDRETISLETWESNTTAVPLYKRNGFTQVDRVWGSRGTLRPVGDLVNGHQVRQDEKKPDRHVVTDRRLSMRYDPDRRYNVRGERVQ